MKLSVAMSVTTCVLAFLYRDWWMFAVFVAFLIVAFAEERAAKKAPAITVRLIHDHRQGASCPSS